MKALLVFMLLAGVLACDAPAPPHAPSSSPSASTRRARTAPPSARRAARAPQGGVVAAIAEGVVSAFISEVDFKSLWTHEVSEGDAGTTAALPAQRVQGPSDDQVQAWLLGVQVPVAFPDGTETVWLVEPGEIVEYAADPPAHGPSGALGRRVQFAAVADGLGIRVWGTMRYGRYTDGRVSDWYMVEFQAEYVQPLGDWSAYLQPTPVEEPVLGWDEW